jgi:DNA-3-methyladenine glycosylase
MNTGRNASSKLPAAFYTRGDVVEVARDLLGKALCSRIDGRLTKVIITETEAYAGIADRASHAYGGRRTPRTEPMFAAGGIAYVYLCYGIHHLFNVVTSSAGNPHAVLVRAGLPLLGIDDMLARRGKASVDKSLLAGPGSLSRALGIQTGLSGTSLSGDIVWIEDHDIRISGDAIVAGPRVGVDYALEDAALPYRFIVDGDRLARQETLAAART